MNKPVTETILTSAQTTQSVSDTVATTVAADMSRRSFLKTSALLTGAAFMGLVAPSIRNAAWAGGSDAPEKKDIKIGLE